MLTHVQASPLMDGLIYTSDSQIEFIPSCLFHGPEGIRKSVLVEPKQNSAFARLGEADFSNQGSQIDSKRLSAGCPLLLHFVSGLLDPSIHPLRYPNLEGIRGDNRPTSLSKRFFLLGSQPLLVGVSRQVCPFNPCRFPHELD